MRGECFLVRTHFGNLTLDVHEDPATGEPIEIIVSAGAAGSDLMADAVALGMAASVLLRLRSDVPALERVEVIADKFRNIGGAKNGASLDVDLCPSCGRYSMEMVEGCRTCRECGFSKCS